MLCLAFGTKQSTCVDGSAILVQTPAYGMDNNCDI